MLTPEQAITQGYLWPLEVRGKMCAVRFLLTTVGLFVGITEQGYEYRYCFEEMHEAIKALADWKDTEHPPGPWIKQKGLGKDRLNPEWSRS